MIGRSLVGDSAGCRRHNIGRARYSASSLAPRFRRYSGPRARTPLRRALRINCLVGRSGGPRRSERDDAWADADRYPSSYESESRLPSFLRVSGRADAKLKSIADNRLERRTSRDIGRQGGGGCVTALSRCDPRYAIVRLHLRTKRTRAGIIR